MKTYQIPGRGLLEIEHLVLDFNGTIAEDGKLIEGIKEKLIQLGKAFTIYVVTADTNGSVHRECEGLPVTVHVIGKEDQLGEKKRFIQSLNSRGVISIGNGVNDEWMFEVSDIAIAVIGKEGCATSSLLKSNIVVVNILDAFDLLLKENRFIATLRK
ncbi:HAD family hydrolase [Tepidibacillus fermentans]|uniref:Soluble P-type ATPase n=1 Tax=Tepidibacillus fermentans TaxID=1281767 RepID=A0A4R3KH22_9BACI|nr:HAD family hydrolase [Tepidibacillus fermentans]TCS82485.1 soluble P-type ATPase [Tepidibacillus fermentans]